LQRRGEAYKKAATEEEEGKDVRREREKGSSSEVH